MLEPEIREIKSPITEPILRVGIILSEDRISKLNVSLSEPRFIIEGFGSSEVLGSGDLEFELRGNMVYSPKFGREVARVLISRDSGFRTMPGSGIGLSPVKAGRGFHWSKEIRATYSGSIEILPSETGLVVVNHVELEDYLASVISSEMSAACPTEFAKAQAIAARSWALVFLGHKHENLPYTICNDDCCQRYQGTTFMTLTTLQAIQACRGQVLVSRGGLVCPAYYSKSCGGRTDTIADILGLRGGDIEGIFDGPGSCEVLNDSRKFSHFLKYPPTCFCSEQTVERGKLGNYLGKVDEDGSYFRWRFELSKSDMVKTLNQSYSPKNIASIESVSLGRRGDSGRILGADLSVRDIAGDQFNINLKNQYEIRQVLQPSFLLSSAFVVEEENKNSLTVLGAGWGHGVGLCQIGALGMALRGESAASILTHYYPQYQLAQSY
jgi:peptidoglycan hydrolase-like amidase